LQLLIWHEQTKRVSEEDLRQRQQRINLRVNLRLHHRFNLRFHR
jgi:hypothetical protein